MSEGRLTGNVPFKWRKDRFEDSTRVVVDAGGHVEIQVEEKEVFAVVSLDLKKAKKFQKDLKKAIRMVEAYDENAD